MAIDTAAKRISAVNVGSPWRSVLPFPDGAIDQGDRQTVTLHYSGILATAVVEAEVSNRSWSAKRRYLRGRRRRR